MYAIEGRFFIIGRVITGCGQREGVCAVLLTAWFSKRTFSTEILSSFIMAIHQFMRKSRIALPLSMLPSTPAKTFQDYEDNNSTPYILPDIGVCEQN